MKERTQTGGQAISGLFTMLLFLVFVLCALFSVLMGSRVYENITKRSDENFSGTTALSYIANKIRQGDREDAVDIIEVDGTPVTVEAEGRGRDVPYLDLLERWTDPGLVYR